MERNIMFPNWNIFQRQFDKMILKFITKTKLAQIAKQILKRKKGCMYICAKGRKDAYWTKPF